MEDLMKTDLYELLQIDINATEKEIKSAYRKKALSCHPDKNPDNPQASELFQNLSKALEILTDEAAKSAYDKLLKAKKEAALRNRLLDSKRRKLKEDLEARERAAQDDNYNTVDAEKRLQTEIERLRKEGSKKLEEERLLLKEQLKAELLKRLEEESGRPRIKVTWKASKRDPENGGYNREILSDIFKKYGEISCLVLGKKGGSSLVEFISLLSAQAAFSDEKGLSSNPVTITWVQGPPPPPATRPVIPEVISEPQANSSPTLVSETDYESVVLTRMRQAQERKRLITEMEKEDR